MRASPSHTSPSEAAAMMVKRSAARSSDLRSRVTAAPAFSSRIVHNLFKRNEQRFRQDFAQLVRDQSRLLRTPQNPAKPASERENRSHHHHLQSASVAGKGVVGICGA